MKRLVKFVIGAAGLSIVLAAIALAVVWSSRERLIARYKPRLVSALSQVTGSEVQFDAVELSLPTTLVVRNLVLGSAADTLKVETVSVVPRILPLLRGVVEINRVVVSGAALLLRLQPEGVQIGGIHARKAAGVEQQLPPREERERGQAAAPKRIALKELRIERSSVQIEDERTAGVMAGRHSITALTLSSGVTLAGDSLWFTRPLLSGNVDALPLSISGEGIHKEGARIEVFPLAIKALGAELSLKGEFDAESSKGAFQVASEKINLATLAAALQPIVPAIVPYKLAGEISPKIEIALDERGFKIEGSSEVREGAALVEGITIRQISGTAKGAFTPGKFSVSTQGVTALVGDRAEKVSLKGTVTGAPLLYALDLRSDGISIDTVRPLLERSVPAVREMKLVGTVAPAVRVRGGAQGTPTVEGICALHKIGFSREQISLSGGDGVLELSSNAGRSTVSTKALTARINNLPEPVMVKGSLTAPPLDGEVEISARNIPAEFVALWSEQLRSKNLSGGFDLRGKIPFKAGQVAGASGEVLLRNVGLVAAEGAELRGVSGAVSLTNSAGATRVSTRETAMTFNGAPLKLTLASELTESAMRIESLSARGLSAPLTFSGVLGRGASKALSAKLRAPGVSLADLERLLPALRGKKLEGRFVKFALDLEGTQGNELLQSLRGSAEVELREGVLRGVNIGRKALEKISALPLIGARLMREIPPEFERAFQDEDTKIQVLSGTVQIAQAQARSRDTLLVTDAWAVKGGGVVGFDSMIDYNTVFTFNPVLSRALATRVQELRPLVNREGVIAFPLQVSGKIPDVRVLPDVEQILKQQTQRAAEEVIGDILQRGLGRGKRPEGRSSKGP